MAKQLSLFAATLPGDKQPQRVQRNTPQAYAQPTVARERPRVAGRVMSADQFIIKCLYDAIAHDGNWHPSPFTNRDRVRITNNDDLQSCAQVAHYAGVTLYREV